MVVATGGSPRSLPAVHVKHGQKNQSTRQLPKSYGAAGGRDRHASATKPRQTPSNKRQQSRQMSNSSAKESGRQRSRVVPAAGGLMTEDLNGLGRASSRRQDNKGPRLSPQIQGGAAEMTGGGRKIQLKQTSLSVRKSEAPAGGGVMRGTPAGTARRPGGTPAGTSRQGGARGGKEGEGGGEDVDPRFAGQRKANKKGGGGGGKPSFMTDGAPGKKRGGGGGGGGKRAKGRGTFFKKLYRKHLAPLLGRAEIEFEDPTTNEAVQALGLTGKQLNKLKSIFDTIDIDGSGSIDQEEFFDMMSEKKGPFTDALFNLIDIDASGAIDFEEFVRTTIFYCMYNKIDVLKFCFDIFDLDRSGAIDEKEFIELCQVINSAMPLFPGNFLSALEMFDVNDDGLIDFNEFVEMDRRFPLVFFPAFRLQDQMKRKTLGLKQWNKLHENIRRQMEAADYAAKHGGMPPPEPPSLVLKRKLMPCFYKKPRKIDTDFIDKHRPSRKIQEF